MEEDDFFLIFFKNLVDASHQIFCKTSIFLKVLHHSIIFGRKTNKLLYLRSIYIYNVNYQMNYVDKIVIEGFNCFAKK